MDAQLMNLCLIEQKYVSNIIKSFHKTEADENLMSVQLQNKLAAMKAELEQQRKIEEMLKAQVESCQEELKCEKALFDSWDTEYQKKFVDLNKKSQVLLNFAETEQKPDYGIKELRAVLDENFRNYVEEIKPLELRRTIVLEEFDKLKKLEEEAKLVKTEAENLMAPTH